MEGTYTGAVVATGLRAPPSARGPRLNQRPRTTTMMTTTTNRPDGDDEEAGIVPAPETAEGGGGEVAFRFRTSSDAHVHPLSQPNFASTASAKTESVRQHSIKPTELNTKSYGNFLKVSPTKRVVSYVGIGRHANDVGAIQSDHPVPTNQLIYYFELTVLDAGRSGCIAIGFTDPLAKLSRQPGWEANSYGYHGDDGHKFHSCGRGEEYGPTFTTGDVIGAGIHLGKAQIFFTKNGKSLGVAFHHVCRVSLFPTIGLHSKGEQVEVNFGEKPFAFNIDGVTMKEKRDMEKEYRSANVDIMDCHMLVRNYLAHYGYMRTLESFDELDNRTGADRCAHADVSEEEPRENECDPGAHRDDKASASLSVACAENSSALQVGCNDLIPRLRALIMAGKSREALDQLRSSHPDVLDVHNGAVYFALKLQEFIEALRVGDTQRGLAIARDQLAPMRGLDQAKDRAIEKAFVLFAFADPVNASPADVQALLTPETRDKVADVAIMALKAREMRSYAHETRALGVSEGDAKRARSLKGVGSHDDAPKHEEEDSGGVVRSLSLEDTHSNGAGSLPEEREKRKREASTSVATTPIEPLQQLLMHLCVLMGQIREKNGQQGEIFDINKFV